MKTAIKKILIGVMCGVMILSGTSCLFTPSAREQAKYKEQIKQELDKIPIEDSRYKIVSLEEGEELPNGMIAIDTTLHEFGKIQVDDNVYKYSFRNSRKDGSEDEYYLIISRNEDEEKTVILNYKDHFKVFGEVKCIYIFESEIFVIRGGVTVGARPGYRLNELYPMILFVYNYETNRLKYAGYGEDWISSTTDVIDYLEKYPIIKHREENENK